MGTRQRDGRRPGGCYGEVEELTAALECGQSDAYAPVCITMLCRGCTIIAQPCFPYPLCLILALPQLHSPTPRSPTA
eukprot:8029618-Pyramimonas_sp.AAC.1